MTSGKAASRQLGRLHSFLYQLRVRDDSPLKLFSRFSILLKTRGAQQCWAPAPPHLPVRSTEIPAARAPEVLDLGQKSLLLLPAGSLKLSHPFLFQLRGCWRQTLSRANAFCLFLLCNPAVAGGHLSLPQPSRGLMAAFARQTDVPPADQHGWNIELCNPPAAEPLALPLWARFLLAPGALPSSLPPAPPVPGVPYRPNFCAQPSPSAPSSLSHLTPAHTRDRRFSPFPRCASAVPALGFAADLPLALLPPAAPQHF